MNYLIVLLFLTGCANSRPLPENPNGMYAGVLPTRDGLIGYRATFPRPDIATPTADSRTKAWFSSAGQMLGVVEQKPIRRKTDLVYLANLPARRLPDSTDRMVNVPALRFWVTVDNSGPESRIYATTFEVTDRKGNYEMLEKQPYNQRSQCVTMWLTDVDAAINEMMASLRDYINQAR